MADFSEDKIIRETIFYHADEIGEALANQDEGRARELIGELMQGLGIPTNGYMYAALVNRLIYNAYDDSLDAAWHEVHGQGGDIDEDELEQQVQLRINDPVFVQQMTSRFLRENLDGELGISSYLEDQYNEREPDPRAQDAEASQPKKEGLPYHQEMERQRNYKPDEKSLRIKYKSFKRYYR